MDGQARSRVLVLASHPFYQERGTAIRLRCMVEALAERGWEVVVLAFPEGQEIRAPGVRTLRLPPIPGLRGIRPGFSMKKIAYDLLLFWHAARLIRRERWTVLHAVEESAFLAIALKRLFGVHYIFDMHSSVAQQMQEKFPELARVGGALDACERAAVRTSCGVIAVSPAIEARVRTFDAEKPVVCVPDAVLPNADALADREVLRETIGAVGPIVMYVGNFEHYQGIDLLLESWPHVLRRRPDAELVLVGGLAVDIARYRARARELGDHVAVHTHFVGPRPVTALRSYLTQADVLVSPRTKGHNTPMKLYSYLAARRPLVATRLSTHTQVLTDDIAVLAVPEPEAFGAAIGDLLNDPERGTALARRAAEVADAEYSMSAFRSRLFTLYDHAIGSGVATRSPADHAGAAR